MTKRILSVILTLAMVASLFTGLGFTAAAAELPTGGSYVLAANVNGSYYAMSSTFGNKISSKLVTVTDGKVSQTDAEGYTVTLNFTAQGCTISNGTVYLTSSSSSTNFGSVEEPTAAAYWTVSDGVRGTYRFGNAANANRGVVFRAGTYNQFGAYALSNVTENGEEYFDLEILPIDGEAVWTWDGNPGSGGYHTEINQDNETRQVACTPGEGVVDPVPTCVATGLETFSCTVCSAVINATVLPLEPHNYVNGVCTVCGAQEPALEGFVLADSIHAGDQILFVDQNGAKAAGPLGGSGSSTYLTAVDAVIGDRTASSEDALVFVVEEGSEAGTFRFKNESAWLTASKAASSNNYLYLVSEEPENIGDLDWTVSFADGLATVSYCSSIAAGGRYLRYNANNNTPRFSGYTSQNASIRNVSIYKLVTGEDLVDVYFVDQDGNGSAYAYAFGSGAENAAFPGELLTALGVDENGSSFYKITLDRSVYTNVIFSGGGSDTQTANLGLGDAGCIVYYVNGHTGYAGDDIWPAPGTVIAPTCTEPGCTRYVGLLTGEIHESAVTDPTGHAWSAWSPNGNNSHTRVCANDETHVETGFCADENSDGVCDVCGGAIQEITGLIDSGDYVITGLVGGQHYALPANMSSGTPDGEAIAATEDTVAENDAQGYVYSFQLQPNGYYTISNGTVYIGSSSSGSSIRTLNVGGELSDAFYWDISAGEYGAYRVTNVAVPSRALAYRSDESYHRFGVYAISNLNGSTYFDMDLLMIMHEQDETDSPEDIDIYFVDETDTQTPYAKYWNANKPADSTAEDMAYPGEALSAQGTEKNGHNYYMITLNTSTYNHILFDNGLPGGVSSGNQTADLNFKADAMTDPLDENGHRYVVYYIYRDGSLMGASVGTDLWPAPPEIQEATCIEPGWSRYVGLRTGEFAEETEIPALGHDFGEWVETTAPSCTAEGEETRACSRCDAVETRPVAMIDHSYEAVVIAPTCTAGGKTVYTCAVCGDSYEDDFTDALGHNPGEPVQENYVEPTATEEGGFDSVIYCQRCGAELDRAHTTLPATGPAEPIEIDTIRIYPSISIGIEVLASFSVRSTDLSSYESWYIEVSKLDGEGNVIESKRFGDGQEGSVSGSFVYKADYTDITAKELGVPFTASVHAFDANGQEYISHNLVSNSPVFTVRDYILGELVNEDNADATRKLAADLLNYGAAAQVYFDFDTENLVNENLST
ncbi:MAG: starch-binding protein, partial [Oscillospiraceae bacterium]|nr:starch-binding protein [Oscillospiraceae bacterium]